MRLRNGSASLVLSTLIAAAASCARAPEPIPAVSEEPLHRLVGILDYIGADYSAAVSDGRIVDTLEHKEQISFARAAREIAASLEEPLAPEIQSQLDELERLCEAAAPVSSVTTLTRSARRQLVETFGLIQSPFALPSAENGARLYEAQCASCHGLNGVPPPEKIAELVQKRRAVGSLPAPDGPQRSTNVSTFAVISGTRTRPGCSAAHKHDRVGRFFAS